MAYSIPEYVDTPEQAILAVASAVKGEQVTGGDGNVGTALDILADALAGENVEVPMTQQGAILALAQYVDGMVKPEGTITITENGEGIDVAQYATADVSVSGGGVDLGPLGWVFVNGSIPVVGEESQVYSAVGEISIGDTIVCKGDGGAAIVDSMFAAGLTLSTIYVPQVAGDTLHAYVCTLDGDYKFATVEAFDLPSTRAEAEYQGDPCWVWTFTMPELQEGEALVFHVYTDV